MGEHVTVNVNCSGDHESLDEKLDRIEHAQHRILAWLDSISQKEDLIMGNLDDLTAQVQHNTDVDQSAIALLNGLSAQLRDLSNDPAAIQALASELESSSSALAAAVSANTPAAPADPTPVDQPTTDPTPVDPTPAPSTDVPGDSTVEPTPVVPDAPAAPPTPASDVTPVSDQPSDPAPAEAPPGWPTDTGSSTPAN